MSYLRLAGGASRYVCYFVLSAAVFALWASLAAGAGFILLQLPDVWASHAADDNSRYAVMSVTAYALIVGALFMIFAAGAIRWLLDALIAARMALSRLREMRNVRRALRERAPSSALQPMRQTS